MNIDLNKKELMAIIAAMSSYIHSNNSKLFHYDEINDQLTVDDAKCLNSSLKPLYDRLCNYANINQTAKDKILSEVKKG